jgi:hypothetical protein
LTIVGAPNGLPGNGEAVSGIRERFLIVDLERKAIYRYSHSELEKRIHVKTIVVPSCPCIDRFRAVHGSGACVLRFKRHASDPAGTLRPRRIAR